MILYNNIIKESKIILIDVTFIKYTISSRPLKLRKDIVFYYFDKIISVSDSIYNIKKVTATKEEND